MFEVIIGKTVAYAAKQGGGAIANINEIDLLAAGAIAVFNEDGDLVASGAAANSQLGNNFFFAVGVATNNPAGGVTVRRSRVIPATPALVVKKSYAAPANKVIEVGYNGASGSLNLPATLVVGSVATMKVYITEEAGAANPLFGKGSAYQPAVKSINVSIRVLASTTQDSLVAQIAAAINNNENNDYVSAAVTGTYAGGNLNIELTGTKYGQNFYVAVDDILSEATKTVTTSIDYGHGTSAQMTELEALANIENGNDSPIRFNQYHWQQPSQVTAGETYATWEYQWDSETDVEVGQNNLVRNRVIVGVGDGDTIETNLTTIAAAFGLTVEDGDAW